MVLNLVFPEFVFKVKKYDSTKRRESVMTNVADTDWPGLIGGRIRKARKEQKLRLRDLSLVSGIEPASLSRIENGKRDIKLSTLIRIANRLQISPSSFLEIEPEPEIIC